MICPKVPGTGIIPSGECLGDPVVLWVRGLSCFFAFELEARLVFVHFDTTTRCEVTGWCCDQPRHFIGAPSKNVNSKDIHTSSPRKTRGTREFQQGQGPISFHRVIIVVNHDDDGQRDDVWRLFFMENE